jgi:hypothetical protein
MRPVSLEPRPIDVALMMVADEDVPLGHRLAVPGRLHGAAIDDTRPCAATAEGVGASVERVAQHLHDAVVGRPAPLDPADDTVAPDHGQRQGGVAKPQEDLPRAAELPKLAEHEPDRFLDPFVGIELDPRVLAPDQPGR